MKFNIVFALIFLSVGVFVFAQNQVSTPVVQKVVTDFFEALSLKETEKMASYCTQDFLLLENGEQWTMDSLKSHLSSPVPSDYKRLNSFVFFNSRISNKQATLHYINNANITANGKHFKIQWLESVGLIKEHGAWKIQWMHSTLKNKTSL